MVITYNEIFTIILCLHALGRKNRASCSITAGQGCIPWEERCLWMAVFGLGSGGAGGGSSQCSNTVSGSQQKQRFVHEEPPTLRRAKQVTSEPRIYVTQLGVLCIPAVFLWFASWLWLCRGSIQLLWLHPCRLTGQTIACGVKGSCLPCGHSVSSASTRKSRFCPLRSPFR